MFRRLTSTSLIGIACLASSVSYANFAGFGNYEMITKDRLYSHLEFIASDLLQGRDTPSAGLDLAALYIASQLKLMGATPAGENGTFFQTLTWGRNRLDVENSSISINGSTVTLGTGALPTSFAPIDTTAEIVYVPSGWSNSEKGVNPFNGIDVKNKIVITDGAGPEGVDRRELFASWDRADVSAKKAGAVALINLAQNPNTANWQRSMDRIKSGGRFAVIDPKDSSFPVITLSTEASSSLFEAPVSEVSAEGIKNAKLKPGAKLSIKMAVIQERQTAKNVIAMIPGSDPTLKKEFVGVGAHYDHVGVGNPDATGDTIFNGADDDGSGTVAMLEMANALAKGTRPKRSVVFVWHCGEEKGLVGSRYFANNPTLDLKQMKFMVNIDMIGMAKKEGDTNPQNAKLAALNEVYLIGPKTISSTMRPIIDMVNDKVHKMKLNDFYDRIDDPERIFYRSDHISYIEKGVPAVFFFSGIHENYHRQSDEIEAINFDQLLLNTQTIFAITYQMAMLDKTPVIDKVIPGIGN